MKQRVHLVPIKYSLQSDIWLGWWEETPLALLYTPYGLPVTAFYPPTVYLLLKLQTTPYS